MSFEVLNKRPMATPCSPSFGCRSILLADGECCLRGSLGTAAREVESGRPGMVEVAEVDAGAVRCCAGAAAVAVPDDAGRAVPEGPGDGG